MKKGLSVLLIVAALFGFYGGATSLNDILASKDYWEEVGEKSTADMNKLEDGLNQLKDNEKAYLDGQKELADGEVKLADAEKQLADGEAKLAAGRAELAQGYADYAAAPAKLRAGEAAIEQGEKDYDEGQSTLAEAKAVQKQLKEGIKKLDASYPTWSKMIVLAWKDPAALEAQNLVTNKSLDSDKINKKLKEAQAFKKQVDPSKAKYDDLAADEKQAAAVVSSDPYGKIETSKLAQTTIGALVQAGKMNPGDKDVYAAAVVGVAQTVEQQIDDGAVQMAAEAGYTVTGITDLAKLIDENIEKLSGLLQLAEGKKTMQNMLVPLFGKVKSNDAAIKALGGEAAAWKLMTAIEKGDDLTFKAAMDKVVAAAPELLKTITRAIHKGENDLKAGAAKLAAGKKELAQGYADYYAAPGKLADGEKQVADGEAQLADGYKQYEDGKKALEDGKKQLAQYEDGEQQVRDGLATLMATEADPGLESILDRRNGDDKFDDASGHLMLDEGLEAVETGRGYQADSGDLITKEITNRGIGTAAGLAAGALAVLAAILSFLKKNKGAAVSAVLAAVAGGVGAGVGLSAGEYYSDIAGSTVGNTPFIAAAILAAVAAVFAIVHFTAKPETK